MKLPATDIAVAHRSDGSGTTYIFVRLPLQGLARVQAEGRRGHVGQLAGRRGRQGQRRRGRRGEADSRRDRLRRADLRAPEQHRVRRGEEQGGHVPQGLARVRHRGRRRQRGQHARGLPGVDHERRRQGRLSDLVLHLDPPVPEPDGQGQEPQDGRLHALGASRTARPSRRTSATRRCPTRWSSSSRTRWARSRSNRNGALPDATAARGLGRPAVPRGHGRRRRPRHRRRRSASWSCS